jgi:hypothetical protein
MQGFQDITLEANAMTTRPTPSRCLLAAALTLASSVRPLSAQNNDSNAGTWQMIVLSGPTQIAVAAPLQVGSSDYQAELSAIRRAQGGLTTAQRRSIDYWSRGGVLRWNEILLELVARANLPPAPSPDGTYPVPDANNPFADRSAELPVVHVRTLDLFRRSRGSVVVPFSISGGRLRRREGGSLHLASVWRHPLSVRYRNGQGARQADRRVHCEIRAARRRGPVTGPSAGLPFPASRAGLIPLARPGLTSGWIAWQVLAAHNILAGLDRNEVLVPQQE